jgi:Tfp pilus assembly protein PilP
MITRTLSSTCIAVLLFGGLSAAQTKTAAKPAPRPVTTTAPKPAQRSAPAPASKATPAPAATAKAPAAPAAATTAAAKDDKDASAKDAAAKDTATIEPQGFTYNAEGRRDPFVSLTRRGSDDRANNGARAGGLAGMASSEVILKGTLISRGGYVGILQGLDNKSYIVRVGDKLSDGSIRSISADAMVILQQVNDPLSLEKEREVRKLLRQTEEAK